MMALSKKLDATAVEVKSGKLPTLAVLDMTLDKAARADLERRWLVTDVTGWYPVSEEPQRHFGVAVEAYAKKDYKTAATEVRKAAAYVRLELARAVGAAKNGLDDASLELNRTALALDKGALKTDKDLDRVFATADHALALAHRAKAAEYWVHKDVAASGYELKAAAHGLESAAAWTGGEAKSAAADAVSSARTVGDKLVNGGVWTRDEVAKGFETLGGALNRLGAAIGTKAKASPVNVDD